jgi:hypothetical protein
MTHQRLRSFKLTLNIVSLENVQLEPSKNSVTGQLQLKPINMISFGLKEMMTLVKLFTIITDYYLF